jgi:hypothetical protein
VRKALRYWDPIGVIEDRKGGSGEDDDEYEGYVLGLLKSTEKGNDAYRLAHHLAGVRCNSMGIGSPKPTEREEDLAEKLVAWREHGYLEEPDLRFTRYAF